MFRTVVKLRDRKVADVSTAHILDTDREVLCLFGVMGNEFGTIVACLDDDKHPDNKKMLRDKGFSYVFLSLLDLAREQGFGYVWFDADGVVTPGLKTFE